MITYEVKKETGQKPRLLKVITVSSSEKYELELNTSLSQSELDSIPTATIMGYCVDLVDYIKTTLSDDIASIALTEVRGDYPYTIWGWKEADTAKREHDEWWFYAYSNREPEE